MYRYSLLKTVYVLSLFSTSVAFSIIPIIAKPNTAISYNYFNPLNDTYNTYDIYKHKLFEIKNNRLSPFSAFVNDFRNLFYPFERKIPLYYFAANTSQNI